jgi:uncharacterized damage-inducible protein DinB
MSALMTNTGISEFGSNGPAGRRRQLTGPIMQLLDELAQVVAALSDEQYVMKPVGVMPSSIGGHVRHSLDHVRALLAAAATGRLDYDRRDRGTPVEASRWAALDGIRQLIDELGAMPEGLIDRPLVMVLMMTAQDPPVEMRSTVAREAGYVVSHTIHHNAIIGAMVKTLGAWLPARFGYAPSTIVNQGHHSCVR